MGPYIMPDGNIEKDNAVNNEEYKDANSPRTTKLTGKGNIYIKDRIMKTKRVPGQSINLAFTN
jgi:hypothetical protein